MVNRFRLPFRDSWAADCHLSFGSLSAPLRQETKDDASLRPFRPRRAVSRGGDGRTGAILSDTADPAAGVVPAGRRRRPCGARGRTAAAVAAWPAGRGGEPARIERQPCRRSRRPCGTRRLYAAPWPERAFRHQSAPLRQDADRPAQGLAAGREPGCERVDAGVQSEARRRADLHATSSRSRSAPSRRCSTPRSATAASITCRWSS